LAFGGFDGDLIREVALCSIGVGDSSAECAGDITDVVTEHQDFRLGNIIFTVCGTPSFAVSTTTVPLCENDATLVFGGPHDVVDQPAYISDTFVSQVDAVNGDTFILSSTISDPLLCGEEIRIGRSDEDVYTVSDCGSNTPTLVNLDRSFRADSDLTNVPLYRRQRTSAIDVEATASDVLDALETLTLISTVEVEKEVYRHGHAWIVTFTTVRDDTDAAALQLMKAIDIDIAATRDANAATVTVYDFEDVLITSLIPGVPYYVRAMAINAHGLGTPRVTIPAYRSPANTVPSQPRYFEQKVLSDTKLLVQWGAPLYSGGLPVTRYEVEWDTDINFESPSRLSRTMRVVAEDSQPVQDIERVTVSFDDDVGRGGTFGLTYHGQTIRIDWNEAAVNMKAKLESLSVVNQVHVTRNILAHGYTWLVTFVDMPYSGDLAGEMSVDSTGLLGTNPTVSLDWTEEVQAVVCNGFSTTASSFRLRYHGEFSNTIYGDSTEEEVYDALQNIYGMEDVQVSFAGSTACETGATLREAIMITFTSLHGDIPE
ncbi:unnamed protein product, partial [Symbiodinium sp. KB8]